MLFKSNFDRELIRAKISEKVIGGLNFFKLIVERASMTFSDRQAFCILVGVYILALVPLFRANFNYIDDQGRALAGYRGWENFSRYTSNFLSQFIHAGKYLTDISPLTQILAVAIIATASIIILRAFRENERLTVWDLAAVIPLGLVPYFLECLSYKYDSPYMALSIFASVMPFAFIKKSRSIYVFSVIVGMLLMCTTYQAASGIFPMLIVLLCFRLWCRGLETKKIKSVIVISALAYVAAIGIFKLLIMTPIDAYASNHVTLSYAIIEHYQAYIHLVYTDFRHSWLWIIALLAVAFIIFAVKDSVRNKKVTAILAVISILVMFVLSFGLYPALSKPIFAPRAMYGVGAFIVCLGVGTFIINKYAKCVVGLVSVGLAWSFIVFSATYGNLLYDQKTYAEFRASDAVIALANTKEFTEPGKKKVYLAGSIGYAPEMARMNHKYNMLRRLVQVSFHEGWGWGTIKLKYYNIDKYAAIAGDNDKVEGFEAWPLLHANLYHEIYAKDGIFVLKLK